MRVTVIADSALPVPPVRYGGSERIVAMLCEELAKRGHFVTLVAAEGSKRYGRLWIHRPPSRSKWSRAYRKLLFQPTSLLASHDADVVHNFGRVDYLWGILKTRVPLVHTFENPIGDMELATLLSRGRGLRLVSVSDHQRRVFSGRGSWHTIRNAVDTERFRFQARTGADPYVVFLGRITANKGAHIAIDVAMAAGIKLILAGNVSSEPGGREYFQEVVSPRLRPGIEYVGEVDDWQKASLLGGARALLFPIQWEEPFALVLGEALACGTPIIALRRACTPEAVEDERTGFLCDSPDEMVHAVSRLHLIDRRACRDSCERTLSAKVMTDQYLRVYDEAIRDQTTGSQE